MNIAVHDWRVNFVPFPFSATVSPITSDFLPPSSFLPATEAASAGPLLPLLLLLFLPSAFFSCGAADRSGRGSVVLVDGVDHFSFSHVQFFGVRKGKTMSQKESEKAKLGIKKGVNRQKLCLTRGVKRQKMCTSCHIDLSKILYSTPQISERIPFLFFLYYPSLSPPFLFWERCW